MGRRLRTLWRLRTGDPTLSVVVATARALVQRLGPHVEDIEPIELHLGDRVDSTELIERLVLGGYRREYQVEHRGELAVRGSIIDVFPSTADAPVRIDLWGDEVERLCEFSVADQRATVDVEALQMFAAPRAPARRPRCASGPSGLLASEPWGREQWQRLADGEVFDGMESWLAWLADREHVLFDLLPDDAQILLVEPRRLRDRAGDIAAEEADLAAHAVAHLGPGGRRGCGRGRAAPPARRLRAAAASHRCPGLVGGERARLARQPRGRRGSAWPPAIGEAQALLTQLRQVVDDGYRVVVVRRQRRLGRSDRRPAEPERLLVPRAVRGRQPDRHRAACTRRPHRWSRRWTEVSSCRVPVWRCWPRPT